MARSGLGVNPNGPIVYHFKSVYILLKKIKTFTQVHKMARMARLCNLCLQVRGKSGKENSKNRVI
jgi:hypothetical protein